MIHLLCYRVPDTCVSAGQSQDNRIVKVNRRITGSSTLSIQQNVSQGNPTGGIAFDKEKDPKGA